MVLLLSCSGMKGQELSVRERERVCVCVCVCVGKEGEPDCVCSRVEGEGLRRPSVLKLPVTLSDGPHHDWKEVELGSIGHMGETEAQRQSQKARKMYTERNKERCRDRDTEKERKMSAREERERGRRCRERDKLTKIQKKRQR